VAESIPDSPEGVILESVLEGMAEYYSLQLSQNILRGQRASAEKCQSTGGNRPLGYLTDPKTKRFVIDPDTAPTVRMIFDMYAKGKTVTEIVKTLNAKGLRTLRGSKFTNNSLHAMLKNEKYIGVYTYKDQVRIEGGVPAIIDMATFTKVQEMLKVNKRAPAHTWNKADYLLTDKLFCGHCGAKMAGESGTSKTGKKHNYYTCTKRKREHACSKKAVRQEWVENLVLDNVLEILNNDEVLNFIADAVWEYYCKEQTKNDITAALRSELAEVDKSQTNIMKAIEAGLFSTATKKRMEELEMQRQELETELANIEIAKDWQISRDYIVFFLKEMRDKNLSDRECQRQLVDTFVNAVYLFDDKLTILFNYSQSNVQTITLADIDNLGIDGQEFVCCAECSTTKALSLR
jgi:hypothetical protein